MNFFETLLSRSPHLNEQRDALRQVLRTTPVTDNAYFVRFPDPQKVLANLEQEMVITHECLDLRHFEASIARFSDPTPPLPEVLFLSHLDSCEHPQDALIQLAQQKEIHWFDQPLHWVIGITPAIESDFRGLLSFLAGKSFWFDFCVKAEFLDQRLQEALTQCWHGGVQWTEDYRQRLTDWVMEVEGTVAPRSELSPSQTAGIALLQGLVQEGQGHWAGLEPENQAGTAANFYLQSLEGWQQGEFSGTLMAVNLRLAYVYLLQAWNEKDRGHFCWQATQHFVQEAIAILVEQDWQDFGEETLSLLGIILRALEDWAQLQRVMEGFLVFLFQLSPAVPDSEEENLPPSCPWSASELALKTAIAYGLLAESLVEQWSFAEAKEALQRAEETIPALEALAPPIRPWLHYLSGRILLGKNEITLAQETLTLAQKETCFEDNPSFYLAILIELRECAYQAQDWLRVLKIDQDYQVMEYQMGKRFFFGPQACPSWEREYSLHPLGVKIPLAHPRLPAPMETSLSPVSVSQVRDYLQSLTDGGQLAWEPDLQRQLLRDIADGNDQIFPLDWQRLGSELEERGITRLDDYQSLGRDQLIWYGIKRSLAFLPASGQNQASTLLFKLVQPFSTPRLRTMEELSESAHGFPAWLLELLVEAYLLIPMQVDGVTYYRLTTPLLSRVLYKIQTDLLAPPETIVPAPAPSQRLNPEGSEAEQEMLVKLANAEQQYQTILEGMRLERQSQVILKQFESQAIEALLAAIRIGQDLQPLIQADTLWQDYPSLGPLSTLQQILNQIQERNRLQHSVSVACLRISPDDCFIATGTMEGVVRIWSIAGELKHTLRGHEGDIAALDWAPGGDYLVSGSGDRTARLWDRQGQLRATLVGHSDALRHVQFSPTEDRILTTSRDKTLRLWNFEGEEVVRYQGHRHWVKNGEFSADGQQILSSSRDGTVRLWDLKGEVIQIFEGHQGWVRNAKFSPDGQRVLTASADKTARIWDLSGHCLAILKGHRKWVRDAQWSPDGDLIITASSDGTARLWNLEGKTLGVLQGHNHSIFDAFFSPDGQRIVTLATDGSVRLWHRSGSLAGFLRGHLKEIHGGQFSRDSRWLVTISADRTGRLWDLGEKGSIPLRGHSHWVRNAHFSPSGDRLLTLSRDNTARLWNLQGQTLAILDSHHDWVREGQFSPDGHLIATASADKTIQLWHSTGNKLATLRGHQDAVLSVGFSSDSQFILTASKDSTARVWNTTGHCLTVLRNHKAPVFDARFGPEGQFIVTASGDKTTKIWDIMGKELATCDGHTAAIYTVQFDGRGELLLTASADGTARLWDFLGKAIATLEGHQSVVYQANFSPDDELIVTASADKTARIWNRQGQELVVLYGHQALVNSAQWSPDGQLIVTASADGTARLWDRLGRELALFQGHSSWVRSAEFSPDGRSILTASTDSTARLWPVDSLSALIDRGCQWLESYLTHNPLVDEGDRALGVAKLTVSHVRPT